MSYPIKCIEPETVQEFQCDGKICSCRCCRDWKIAVDEETLKKSSSRPEILKNLSREDDGRTFLKLDENGHCLFLGEDFLCKLQKNCGEDFLPAVCQTYPRIVYKFSENLYSRSLTLTCPVAAKTVLFREEPAKFIEVPEVNSRMILDWSKKIPVSPEDFFADRAECIKILRDENFSIDERLQNLLLRYAGENFIPQKTNPENIVDLFDEIYDANFDANKKSEIKKIYREHGEKILNLFESIFGKALENYLVNEFFMRCYPYAFTGDELHNIKIFLTGFEVLKFAAVITIFSKMRMTIDEFINLICAVQDKIDHSRQGMIKIIEYADRVER